MLVLCLKQTQLDVCGACSGAACPRYPILSYGETLSFDYVVLSYNLLFSGKLVGVFCVPQAPWCFRPCRGMANMFAAFSQRKVSRDTHAFAVNKCIQPICEATLGIVYSGKNFMQVTVNASNDPFAFAWNWSLLNCLSCHLKTSFYRWPWKLELVTSAFFLWKKSNGKLCKTLN